MVFIFTLSGYVMAQKTVTGSVVGEEDGTPIPGVNVILKGASVGTVTDIDGTYQIAVPDEGGILVFSFIGLVTEEVDIGNQSMIDMVMIADLRELGEVIVTAYGTTTKEAFTGSASVIDSEQLLSRNVTSPIAAIEGNATGVQFTSPAGPGDSPGIVIRGVGTLNGSTTPLYIVDGVQYNAPLNTLNQEDIESFTILKDAASTSLYGSRAANGVVMITTKKGQQRRN
jgi:TonB-dependent SusC/RagA subfamily outer membrane receptor